MNSIYCSKRALALLLSVLAAGFTQSSYAATDVLFIVDSSGSMKSTIGGKMKIDSAREGAIAALSDIPAGSHVGLRVYGHRIDQKNKAESCKDSELAVPLSELNRNAFVSKLTPLSPKGYTPLAYSLEQARNDFSVEREAKKVIILLSDGAETCDGDPVGVVEKLRADGFDVQVYTVGFDVKPDERKQLQAIAKAGHGEYFDAANGDELRLALKDATKKSLFIDKKGPDAHPAREVRGGDSFDTAVELPLGEALRLDHHQRGREFDYFYVNLSAGQELAGEVHTYEQGIRLLANGKVQAGSPEAGIAFHGTDKARVKRAQIYGKAMQTETLSIVAPSDGRYFVLVGSDSSDMDKDFTSFTVSVNIKGDLNAAVDAGALQAKAMPIVPGLYEKNYLGGADSADVFSFEAKAGEQYQVTLLPVEGAKFIIRYSVKDDMRALVANGAGSGQGVGVRGQPFTIKTAGKYFLYIEQYGGDRLEEYSLDFKQISAKE